MAQASLAGKKRIKFQIKAEKNSDVYVAGTFNGWNPKRNKLKFENGAFSTSILVTKGRHEYKFVVDGTWCVDPECSEWAPNGIGSLNSVINVG